MRTSQPTFDIVCDDNNEFQRFLNELCNYNDVTTKIYHRSRIALFCRLTEQLISDGVIRDFDSALDIGCNTGFYSNIISNFGFREVLGVDINEDYIAKANRTFYSDRPGKRISFQALDAATLPQDRSYSFILCTEVIEHTDTPDAVIDAIMTLLAPGGTAIISLPNSLSLGYSTAYVAALAKRRELNKALLDHLKYPAYLGPRLFKRKGARILRTAGVNSLFNDPSVRLLHRAPFFDTVNRINFWVSRRWPWKWIAQFFFFVVTKDIVPNVAGQIDLRRV